ncbi:hypothetical protein [Halorubrum kocurii]|uniref:Uncharacterized protein n=1 Tax=Halorubrum kocurii JCM 14978 TaxID=1230456 RepID=M0P9F3_9EURY|nr:hypothetical protein [Halorubrum kocurii]EMA66194.1 hypothetical protein C468_05181 [Halorubrum kocurii JCM 14978]
MRRDISVFRPVEAYAEAGSSRTHGVVAIISFCMFVGTIIFGFIPVTREIETSGYSTADLQESTNRTGVDTILQAFEPIMDSVVLLSMLDYLFIVAGFFLFFSLHSLVMQRLSFDDRLVLIPKLGMVLTVCSRLLDSLENFWVILIYSNPDSYPTVLISLMNTTQSAKWLVVTVEYPTLGLAIVLVLLVKFTSLFDRKTPQI